MRKINKQNMASSDWMKSGSLDEQDSKSLQNTQYDQENQIEGNDECIIQFRNIKITKKQLKYVFICIIVLAFGIIWFQNFQTFEKKPLNKPVQQQRKPWSEITQKQRKQINEEQQIWKECSKKDSLGNHGQVFFISFDMEDLPKKQLEKFQKMNNICKFQVNDKLAFDYFVDLWNQREQQARFDQAYINKTALTKEQKRLLFIWLKLYFKAGIYIHPSLGVNFGKYINERYLLDAQVAKEILFARVDHQNEKGIFVPERNFKTVKVGRIFSEYIRKIILKIVAKEDWMEICEKYQCIIIKDALKYPQEL